MEGIEHPLHRAVRDGDRAKLLLLIEQGADVNDRNQWEETPLHWAAMIGPVKVIHDLLSNGADVNARTNNGRTPLTFAVDKKMKALALLLISKGGEE